MRESENKPSNPEDLIPKAELVENASYVKMKLEWPLWKNLFKTFFYLMEHFYEDDSLRKFTLETVDNMVLKNAEDLEELAAKFDEERNESAIEVRKLIEVLKGIENLEGTGKSTLCEIFFELIGTLQQEILRTDHVRFNILTVPHGILSRLEQDWEEFPPHLQKNGKLAKALKSSYEVIKKHNPDEKPLILAGMLMAVMSVGFRVTDYSNVPESMMEEEK